MFGSLLLLNAVGLRHISFVQHDRASFSTLLNTHLAAPGFLEEDVPFMSAFDVWLLLDCFGARKRWRAGGCCGTEALLDSLKGLSDTSYIIEIQGGRFKKLQMCCCCMHKTAWLKELPQFSDVSNSTLPYLFEYNPIFSRQEGGTRLSCLSSQTLLLHRSYSFRIKILLNRI